MIFRNEKDVLAFATMYRVVVCTWIAVGTVGLTAVIAVGKAPSANLSMLILSGFLIWALLGAAIRDYFGHWSPGRN